MMRSRSLLAPAVLLAPLVVASLPVIGGCRAPSGAALAVGQDGAGGDSGRAQAEAQLVEAAAAEGILVDLERGVASIPVRVTVTEDLLEYLLTAPHGAMHETLFSTEVRPSALNAALLALGVRNGRNATWEELDPPPSDEEMRAGASPYRVIAPEGDGFFLYVGWREGDETYFYRVEDVLSNLRDGRSMRRHRWVFLGSRFHAPNAGDEERFVADVEGNLVNVSFFYQGNTLVTAALPECESQTIWVANPWMLPPPKSEVALFFARERLSAPPAGALAANRAVIDAGERSRGEGGG